MHRLPFFAADLNAFSDVEVSDLLAAVASLADETPLADPSESKDTDRALAGVPQALKAVMHGFAVVAEPSFAAGWELDEVTYGPRLFTTALEIEHYFAGHPGALFEVVTRQRWVDEFNGDGGVYDRATKEGRDGDDARVSEGNTAADLLSQRLAYKRADAEADRIIAAEAYDGLGGVVSWEELEDLSETPWLVPDLIAFGETALLVAKRNVGKSMLAMALGFCVATGSDFLGRRIRGGKVLFVLGEGSRGFAKRMYAWCAANGIAPDAIKANVVVYRGGNLSNDASLADIKSVAARLSPALVVVDTYSSVSGIADEVKPALAADVVNRLKEIAPDAAKLVLHHPNGESENTTAPKARGGSTLPSNVDTVMTMWVDRSHAVAGLPSQDWLAISTEEEHEGKQKDDVRLTIRGLRIATNENGAYLDWRAGDSLTRADQWVMQHIEMGETATIPGLIASTGQARNTVKGHLRSSRLVREGAGAAGAATCFTRIG